jgi:SAM-dependent methyltransferase
MLLQELLGICEELYFVEESYLSQREIENTLKYFNRLRNLLGKPKMRLLRVREGEKTLGILIFNPAGEEVPVDFWSVFTGALAATPLKKEFEILTDALLTSNPPEKDIETSSEIWRDAVNEYYSLMLVNRNLCPGCTVKPEAYKQVFSENRVQKVEDIFNFLQKRDLYPEGRILEVCCGNGMSTLALYRLGLDPFAVEIDKCAVCQGIEQRVLNPKKVMVMDATALSKYFEPGSFDVVLGFMLGLIYEFNKDLWTGIIKEAVSVASEDALVLFTVSSKPEIEILAQTLQKLGVKGEIVDNTDSEGTYDQWFFVGRKKLNF